MFSWSVVTAQQWFIVCTYAWVPPSLCKCVLWIYLKCIPVVGDPRSRFTAVHWVDIMQSVQRREIRPGSVPYYFLFWPPMRYVFSTHGILYNSNTKGLKYENLPWTLNVHKPETIFRHFCHIFFFNFYKLLVNGTQIWVEEVWENKLLPLSTVITSSWCNKHHSLLLMLCCR